MRPIEEIRQDLSRANAEKSGLVQQKIDLQSKVREINAACSGRVPNTEYQALQRRRASIANEVGSVDRRIVECKSRITDLANEEYAQRNPDPSSDAICDAKRGIVQELVSLRAHYQQFSADATRVSSMRQMAADFVLKLNPIIRRAVGSDAI